MTFGDRLLFWFSLTVFVTLAPTAANAHLFRGIGIVNAVGNGELYAAALVFATVALIGVNALEGQTPENVRVKNFIVSVAVAFLIATVFLLGDAYVKCHNLFFLNASATDALALRREIARQSACVFLLGLTLGVMAVRLESREREASS